MNDWLKPCPHGVYEAHAYLSSDLAEDDNPWFRRPMNGPPERWCPGGRPATLEDLGGKEIDWCEVHQDRFATASYCWAALFNRRSDPPFCPRSKRILLPLPQMVAE